jgi:exonuclease VII small subunit
LGALLTAYPYRMSTHESAALRTRQKIAVLLLALLVIGSGIVAWRVPVPKPPPAAAWESPWVFRGEVFVGSFVAAYVVLAICGTTVVSGRPPKKLSFGLLAYEQAEFEKAVEALSEGGTALQAVEAEVRALQRSLNQGLQSTRAAVEALIDAAAEGKADGRAIERAKANLAALPEQATPTDQARRDFDQAMARFDRIIVDLERLRARRDKSRN